jgi:molybdenum cofactor cytidylyltransferase
MGCILKGGGGLYSRLAVGAVLLAAGEARRLGGQPKALLELGGVPLIRRVLIALSGAGVDEVAVVLGHRAAEVEAAVRDFPVTLVHNSHYALGQASSVRAGLAALSPKLDAVIVAVADQPLLNAEDVSTLLGAFKRARAAAQSDDESNVESNRAIALVPHVAGMRANPIVLDGALREDILLGDVNFGCRQWLLAHPERVHRFDTDNQHYCVDVDTPEDLQRFAERYGHALRWPGISAA